MMKLFQSNTLFYLNLSTLHNRAVQLLPRSVRLHRTLESHEAEALHVHTAVKSVDKIHLNSTYDDSYLGASFIKDDFYIKNLAKLLKKNE